MEQRQLPTKDVKPFQNTTVYQTWNRTPMVCCRGNRTSQCGEQWTLCYNGEGAVKVSIYIHRTKAFRQALWIGFYGKFSEVKFSEVNFSEDFLFLEDFFSWRLFSKTFLGRLFLETFFSKTFLEDFSWKTFLGDFFLGDFSRRLFFVKWLQCPAKPPHFQLWKN